MGYEIRFIDVASSCGFICTERDRAIFDKIKRELFNKDRNARVIVYIGANHIGEIESPSGVYLYEGKRKPLGYFLSNYTKGRNFSVYIGHTYDTPAGCDLSISRFIWETYRQAKPAVIRPD